MADVSNNGVDKDNLSLESIKGKKLEDVLDFLKVNAQLRALTKELEPASIFVQAGKDFVELKILMAKPELAQSIKVLKK